MEITGLDVSQEYLPSFLNSWDFMFTGPGPNLALTFPFPQYLLCFLPITRAKTLADLVTIERALYPNGAAASPVQPPVFAMLATPLMPAIKR